MDRIVEKGLLYDYYGALLTPHQQKIYEQAVIDDMSLSEIAEGGGVSRQAVSDLLIRSTQALKRYEKKLGLMERDGKLLAEVETLKALDPASPDYAKAVQLGLSAMEELLK